MEGMAGVRFGEGLMGWRGVEKGMIETREDDQHSAASTLFRNVQLFTNQLLRDTMMRCTYMHDSCTFHAWMQAGAVCCNRKQLALGAVY